MSDPEEDFHETTESVDAGKHGKDYELLMAKFIFKRLCDSSGHNFKFTREKKGLGKFDDFVYIYQKPQGRKKICLVQLKHVSDMTRKIDFDALSNNRNSYFLLSKYFAHYTNLLASLSTNIDFIDAELEALIICTNLDLSEDLEGIQKETLKVTGSLRWSGIQYKLCIPNHLKWKMFSNSYLSEGQMLARELVHYIMLDKRIDLNCLKRDEHASFVKDHHIMLAMYVIDVSKKRFKEEFLHDSLDGQEIFKFREWLLEAFSDFEAKFSCLSLNKLKINLKLKLKNAEKLKKRITEYQSSDSIREFLLSLRIEVNPDFGHPAANTDLLAFLRRETQSREDIDRRIDEFLNLLVFATGENETEKIIREELSPELFLAFNEKMSKWYHVGSIENNMNSTIRKRKWVTKENILKEAMEMSLCFQGKKRILKELIDPKHIIIGSDAMLRIFCSEILPLGNMQKTLGEVKDYYIPRILTAGRIVQEKVIEMCSKDIFIISGTNLSILKNRVRNLKHEMCSDIYNCDISSSRIIFISTDFTHESFIKFVKNNSLVGTGRESIHWLHYCSSQLQWQNTFGSLTTLKKHLSRSANATELVRESQLINCSLIIVSGEPGIGKSTLLNSISENLIALQERMEKPKWIIQIDLKNSTQILEDITEFQDIESVFRFLCFFEKTDDELSKAILHLFINGDERIILLLDGFDELSYKEHEGKIIQLIKFLKFNLRFAHICLTTRPHLVEKLEDCLGVLALSMKEISQEEQICFLSKFLKSNCHQRNEITSVHRIIENFDSTLHDQCKGFLGIPLHTYMFALVYLQAATQQKEVAIDSLKITSLFETFLQSKYDIYFRKSEESLRISDKRKKLFRNLLDDAHKDFALRYGGLLSPEEADFFHLESHSFEDDDLLDIGIVYKVNGQLHFSNQTFAEYLVAKRLVEIAMKENETMKTIVKKVLLNTKKRFVLYLFDLKLTEYYHLHGAVLNGNTQVVSKCTKMEVNAEDCLGRRMLYYALHYEQSDMIDILIDKGALVNGKDEFSARALFRRMSFIS